MATLNSTISGSDTGDTLIGTESDQLISAGTGADSIGSAVRQFFPCRQRR